MYNILFNNKFTAHLSPPPSSSDDGCKTFPLSSPYTFQLYSQPDA